MTFDLERIKADLGEIGDPRFCDCEVRTQLAAAIAEIERLQKALDESEKVVAYKSKSADHWYQECLQKGVDLRESKRTIEKQAARVQELESQIARLGRLAFMGDAPPGKIIDHFVWWGDSTFDALQKDKARIKELEDALKEEKAWTSQYQKWLIEEVAEGMSENGFADDDLRQRARDSLLLDGKIGPDAKPKEGLYGKYRISKADGSPVDPKADYFVLRLDTDPVARRAAREYSYMTVDRKLALDLQERITKYNPKMMDCINLQFFGMERPMVWQITDERKAAIEAMCNLSTDIVCPACGAWIAFDDIRAHMGVLQGMLREAEQ